MPPLPTQVPSVQQPPLPHRLPLQHGCPGPPHGWHWPELLQASPEAVQKSRTYVSLLWQHCCPWPPQVPQEFEGAVHTPSGWPLPTWPPQPASTPTQVEPAQHPEVQVFSAQHGCPGPPHAVNVPCWHTRPSVPFFPLATQRPVVGSAHEPLRQAWPVAHTGCAGWPQGTHAVPSQVSCGPVQVLPLQHGWSRPPQPAHESVDWQTSPRAHRPPTTRQRGSPGLAVSQQLPPQVLPAQQGWPGRPHARQYAPEQTLPPAHAPAQHGSPGPPHLEQTWPLQPRSGVTHGVDVAVQHGSPRPPQLRHALCCWSQPWRLAVQNRPWQHACPSAPQPPSAQLPPLQVPPSPGHAVPSARHWPVTQQPLAQVFAPQQGCPGWPHTAHSPAVPPPVQTRLAPQLRPGQHAWPPPPQPWQVPPTHAVPAMVHWLPAQHGWPEPPHAWQDPLTQLVPAAVHELPAQHVSPEPPHDWQVPLTHEVPPAVQVFPVQHGWPSPPQPPQLPPAQVPLAPQVVPSATQAPLTQQPPAPHELPAQQGWPGVPQLEPWHNPPRQVAPVAHASFAQQGWPVAPHTCAWQLPATHEAPTVQVEFAQQAWPGPPQLKAWQVPPPQTFPFAHDSPAQHGLPSVPQSAVVGVHAAVKTPRPKLKANAVTTAKKLRMV